MRILLIFLSAGLFVTCSAPKKENVPRNELPAILLTLVSGEKLMASTLEGRTILLFYVPDCDHCQREAEAIRGQLNAFKDYSLYFIAASEPDEMNRFAERYGLKGFANVYFARAEVADVIREMGSMGTPCLFIYSKEKRLIKKFDGETNVNDIVSVL